jgi:antirestriction protein ArdC
MDVYGIVTEKIVGLLEQEVVPWRKPWATGGLPRNLVTRKPYRGVNLLLLSATKYLSPYWATMRQINELGGRVRKGEESTLIVYWQIRDAPEKPEGLKNNDAKGEPQRRFLLRYYRTWNLDQCEMPQAVVDKLPRIETHQHEPIAAAERIIAGMPNPPIIQRGGSQAFYSPVTDHITLPPRELFESAEAEAAVTFHEIAHATGAPQRLNRASITDAAPFSSPVYASEELIAEISAAFLCAESGISTAVLTNQAAYVSGWLKALRDDRRLVVHAAAHAQHATDYILGRAAKNP